MKTYLYFLSLFLILLNCKQESKPPFRPELANPPLNIDGNKLPFFRGKEMDLDGSKEKEPENLRRLSNFTLTTEKNKNIIQDDINGKITLVYFFR